MNPFLGFGFAALAAATLVAGGCTSIDASGAGRGPATAATRAPEGRQILVMLTEVPVRHFQPGAAGGADYRSRKPASGRVAEQLGAEFGFEPVDNWLMPSLGVRCYLAEVAPGAEPEKVVGLLMADARVESAEVVRLFHPSGRNDPYYSLQENAKLLQFEDLHSVATGRNVLVAVIDTGIELSHPDLLGQFADAQNFVDGSDLPGEIHGTAVAGIIAAKADNGIGIVGVAPGARLLALRGCWQLGAKSEGALCSSFTLARALQFALIRRARVINLSLAGPRDRLLERLLDNAIGEGVAVIAAVDADSAGASFPATHPGVIGVNSRESKNRSTDAAAPGLTAPGVNLLTTVPHANWGFVSGSSFATAEISGVAALLLEAAPTLSPKDVIRLIAEFSHKSSEANGSGPGAVALDACAMLASISKKRECPCCNRIALPEPATGQVDRPS